MNVDVSLVATQPSRSGYPRIIDALKEAVAANLAHTGEPALKHHWQILLHCMSPLLAQSRHIEASSRCPLSGVKRTKSKQDALSAYDAVDGAHSAASRCHRVVVSKHTT
jgi:hypothetical protein